MYGGSIDNFIASQAPDVMRTPVTPSIHTLSERLVGTHGRPRIITGRYDGAEAERFGYSQYNDHFSKTGEARTIHPVAPMNGDYVRYGNCYAHKSLHDGSERTPHKWRLLFPSITDLFDRFANRISGEAAINQDQKTNKNVYHDKAALAQCHDELFNHHTGLMSCGSVSTERNPFFETGQGEATRLERITRGDGRPQGRIGYIEFAKSLLIRPSAYLRAYYEVNPNSDLKNVIENIANTNREMDLGEREFKTIQFLILAHLDMMEAGGEIDPGMLAYVHQGDPKYVRLQAIKDTYERIYRVAIGHIPERVETDKSLALPLAIHMRDKFIPVTYENIVDELRGLEMVREVAKRLITSYGEQLSVTKNILDIMNPEELKLMEYFGQSVVPLLAEKGEILRTLPIYGFNAPVKSRMSIKGEKQFPVFGSEHTAGGFFQAGARDLNMPDRTGEPSQIKAAEGLTYQEYNDGNSRFRFGSHL